MALIDTIRADRMAAYKAKGEAKENIKKNVLGCLIADSCKEDKEPSDQKVLATIKKFIEGAELVIEHAEAGSYEAYQAGIEIEILSTYRPAQMDEAEISLVVAACVLTGCVGVGPIMKHFKQHFDGRYDAKLVSTIASQYNVR